MDIIAGPKVMSTQQVDSSPVDTFFGKHNNIDYRKYFIAYRDIANEYGVCF